MNNRPNSLLSGCRSNPKTHSNLAPDKRIPNVKVSTDALPLQFKSEMRGVWPFHCPFSVFAADGIDGTDERASGGVALLLPRIALELSLAPKATSANQISEIRHKIKDNLS